MTNLAFTALIKSKGYNKQRLAYAKRILRCTEKKTGT